MSVHQRTLIIATVGNIKADPALADGFNAKLLARADSGDDVGAFDDRVLVVSARFAKIDVPEIVFIGRAAGRNLVEDGLADEGVLGEIDLARDGPRRRVEDEVAIDEIGRQARVERQPKLRPLLAQCGVQNFPLLLGQVRPTMLLDANDLTP